VVRYYLMSTHYRSPIDFSHERLGEAAVAYARLRSPLERADAWAAPASGAPSGVLGQAVAEAEKRFHEAMEDDFNSAKAIGHLFELSREVNRALDERAGSEAARAAGALMRLGGILGLFWRAPAGEAWSEEVLGLAAEREAARKGKDWARSDALRQRLLEQGVVVEDGPGGQKLRRRP
jgi:cysteinyl-tRNA synthetase